jgi:phosphoribosylglycinamide formyltransferase 1
MYKIKIIPLISGTGTNMIAIDKACREGRINGEVVAVGSDNPNAEGLDYVREKGIPDFIIDYNMQGAIKEYQEISNMGLSIAREGLPEDFDIVDILAKEHVRPVHEPIAKKMKYLFKRAKAEAQLLKELRKYPYDLLVLAGFMRVMMPYAIDRININGLYRIMNIHPALLPAFPGTDGYGDTFKYGCKVGGCTVHFVDYGEDTGPIIGQRAYSIYPGDTLKDIKKRGLALEWELYPECIQLFAEGRLEVVERDGRKVVEILPSGIG